jgi:hypothetical protein
MSFPRKREFSSFIFSDTQSRTRFGNLCNPTKQSRVKRLTVVFFSFFIQHRALTLPKAACWLDRRPHENGPVKSSSQYGRRSQTALSGLSRQDLFQADCLHSYSCSPISDGTLNFIQPKAPILSDVVPKGPHLTRPGYFRLSRRRTYLENHPVRLLPHYQIMYPLRPGSYRLIFVLAAFLIINANHCLVLSQIHRYNLHSQTSL